MQVTSAKFTPLANSSDPTWVLRLEVEATGLVHCASALIASVGTVPVELMLFRPDGKGFVGLLRTMPLDGAQIQLGYTGIGVMDTGFFYSAPV